MSLDILKKREKEEGFRFRTFLFQFWWLFRCFVSLLGVSVFSNAPACQMFPGSLFHACVAWALSSLVQCSYLPMSICKACCDNYVATLTFQSVEH